MKKLLAGQFIINKSRNGDEIDAIYNYISEVALNPQIPSTTRMNAADILSISNNRRYMGVANQALELLRREDDAPRRALRRPGGGQKTLHLEQEQEPAQPARVPPRPHQRIGQPQPASRRAQRSVHYPPHNWAGRTGYAGSASGGSRKDPTQDRQIRVRGRTVGPQHCHQ